MPDPFLTLVSAMNPNIVPRADAEDSMAGATDIPSEVTDSRRRGKQVAFVQKGERKNWYWVLPNNKKIYHP